MRMETGTVDCHAHVYHRAMPLAGDAWHRPEGEALAESYVAALDANGIERGVLAAASIFGTSNEYMLESLAGHPRLRATAIVDPDIGPDALKALDAQGVVGIRLQWRYLDRHPDLTSDAYRRLLRHVADLGWHIHLHDDAGRLADAIPMIEASGVPLVIDHFGRPALGLSDPGFEAILRAVDRGRTWVKLSAGFRVGPPDMVAELASALLAHAGAERLLWGSDWPFTAHEDRVTYRDTLRTFAALVPDKGIRDKIHRTARRLYFGEE